MNESDVVPTEQDGALIEAMARAIAEARYRNTPLPLDERREAFERARTNGCMTEARAALAVARPVIAAETRDKIADALRFGADPTINDGRFRAGWLAALSRARDVVRSLPLTEETS